jgi:hypothetical protein
VLRCKIGRVLDLNKMIRTVSIEEITQAYLGTSELGSRASVCMYNRERIGGKLLEQATGIVKQLDGLVTSVGHSGR